MDLSLYIFIISPKHFFSFIREQAILWKEETYFWAIHQIHKGQEPLSPSAGVSRLTRKLAPILKAPVPEMVCTVTNCRKDTMVSDVVVQREALLGPDGTLRTLKANSFWLVSIIHVTWKILGHKKFLIIKRSDLLKKYSKILIPTMLKLLQNYTKQYDPFFPISLKTNSIITLG
jgi:hypothetical protein